MTKLEWLEKNGFDENGITHCIYGEDTYSIKDFLKENKSKFHPILKWHVAEVFDLPEDYDTFEVKFDDILQWSEADGQAYFYESAQGFVDRKFREAEGPSLSEYVGEVGERLRNLTAVFKSSRGFMGAYGWTSIYTFQIGEDVLVWFTQKDLDLEKGETIDLTATVKKHEEFRGVKTTQLSRCIIKPIN